jgi:hypothetical protein
MLGLASTVASNLATDASWHLMLSRALKPNSLEFEQYVDLSATPHRINDRRAYRPAAVSFLTS